MESGGAVPMAKAELRELPGGEAEKGRGGGGGGVRNRRANRRRRWRRRGETDKVRDGESRVEREKGWGVSG